MNTNLNKEFKCFCIACGCPDTYSDDGLQGYLFNIKKHFLMRGVDFPIGKNAPITSI